VVSPTNTNFSKPDFCCDIPFLRGQDGHEIPL